MMYYDTSYGVNCELKFKELKMKDIIVGFLLMFNSYSCIQFWYWFKHLEKSKQVKLIDFIFGGKNDKK